jgi:hypothetical protein
MIGELRSPMEGTISTLCKKTKCKRVSIRAFHFFTKQIKKRCCGRFGKFHAIKGTTFKLEYDAF